MIEFILGCSLFSCIMSTMLFVFYITDETRGQNKLAALTMELKRTKRELSSERSKRIKAENDAAYYHDRYYIPELDPRTPEFNNF